MNIKFSYRYRDGGNYKQNGFEVFTNKEELSIEHIEQAIKTTLIDGAWFYADKWNLKDLHLYKWDNEIDHEWHEYDCIEKTEESASVGDIADFIHLIQADKAIF